jgi:chromosome condensin MukBEF complex kleisin-like MukF subunit
MSTATEQTNHTIKDSLLSHISSGLHEGKVIYREGFVGIVRLDEIRVTDRGFSATAVPITQIDMSNAICR